LSGNHAQTGDSRQRADGEAGQCDQVVRAPQVRGRNVDDQDDDSPDGRREHRQ